MTRLHAYLMWKVALIRWGWRCGQGRYDLSDESHTEIDHWYRIWRGRT